MLFNAECNKKKHTIALKMMLWSIMIDKFSTLFMLVSYIIFFFFYELNH